MLPDQALEHRDRLADRGVEMQDARLEHLLSAERQELLGERGGSMRRPLDQIEVLARLGAPLEALQEDFAATMDDRQEVVEVVGHAAGETADRVHLLGLQERLLSPRHLFGGHLDLAEEPRVFQGGCGLRRERGRDPLVVLREAGGPPGPDRQHAGHALTDLDGHAEERAIAQALDRAPVGRDEPCVLGYVVEPEGRARSRDDAAQALAELDSARRHRLLGVAPEPGDHELVALDQAKADGLRLEHAATRRRDRPQQLLDRLDPRQLVAHVEQALESSLIGVPRLEQLSVADRDRRLRGQPSEPRLVAVGERPRRAVEDEEHPFDARLGLDRHRQGGLDAFRLGQRLGVVPEARIVLIVVRPERPPGQQHLAADALARQDPVHGGLGGARPVAHQHRLSHRVARGDDAEIRPAQLARRLPDPLQDHVEVERGGDLARELGEDLGFTATALRVLEEPRLFERHGRLIDECLRQAHLIAVVRAPFVIADGDRADDPVVDDHRQGEHRPVRPRLERLAQLRRQRDPRIGEEVRRGDGAPGSDGAAHRPDPRGEHDVDARAVGRHVPADERTTDRLDPDENR